MTNPLLLVAASGLALCACAPTQPARTVFISSLGAHGHVQHGGPVVVRTYRHARVGDQVHVQTRRPSEGGAVTVHTFRGATAPHGPLTVETFRRGPAHNRVVVIRRPGDAAVSAEARADALRHAEAARRLAGEAKRFAELARPRREDIDRITREARVAGEEARRQGDAARVEGDEARRRGEALRRQAERLREQCERGEIGCEIIVTD